jgi:hypothetical protein
MHLPGTYSVLVVLTWEFHVPLCTPRKFWQARAVGSVANIDTPAQNLRGNCLEKKSPSVGMLLEAEFRRKRKLGRRLEPQ